MVAVAQSCAALRCLEQSTVIRAGRPEKDEVEKKPVWSKVATAGTNPQSVKQRTSVLKSLGGCEDGMHCRK